MESYQCADGLGEVAVAIGRGVGREVGDGVVGGDDPGEDRKVGGIEVAAPCVLVD